MRVAGRPVSRSLRGAALALAAVAGSLGAGAGSQPPAPPALPGIAVTSGAAPGYVPDRACATCHDALYRSYQEVGMARSFYRPRPDRRVEDFAAAPLYHAPSRQYFQISPRGDGLVFRRWQRHGEDTEGTEGREVRVWETGIDWILGSGNHSRTYLYRTPDGALFQLPLAWYAQERRWGMAPGYDRPDHDGILRRVRRECLFCHNAYPDVPAGSDAEGMPHTFPAELPEGTGCQRCHGPGAEHVDRALGGVEPRQRIREAIVNPARLPPATRDDVCFQCHLQPLVALAGARRLGRGDFSFRPGEALAEYQAHVDAAEEGGADADRFEINHHGYRLRKSRCFLASAGRLSCLTCHDPHRRVPAEERAAHYRAACQGCHAADACRRPGRPTLADTSDCAACHMPKRRPRDVVHVVMTDHWIRSRPGGPELLAPLAETDPVLTGVRLIEPERFPGAAAEVYRTLPVARLGTSDDAVDHLGRLVAAGASELSPAGPAYGDDLRLELAVSQLRRRRPAAAEQTLGELAKLAPPTAHLLAALAAAREALGKTAEAEALYREALARPGRSDIERAEAATHLARLLAGRGQHREAADLLESAVAQRPNLVAAWLRLGNARAALGDTAAAEACFRRALEIDPASKAAELGLAVLAKRQAGGS